MNNRTEINDLFKRAPITKCPKTKEYPPISIRHKQCLLSNDRKTKKIEKRD